MIARFGSAIAYIYYQFYPTAILPTKNRSISRSFLVVFILDRSIMWVILSLNCIYIKEPTNLWMLTTISYHIPLHTI